MRIALFDTTLRDGTQMEGLSLSVEDKLKIARMLDGFGIDYIEGGWPASNPKDSEFFRRGGTLGLEHAKLTAFGSTRKARSRAQDDGNLRALVEAETPAVSIFGKSWLLHVKHVLGTTPEENLAMVADSVAFLKSHGREVIYDAEHFFDGYRADADYALATVKAAAEAGADCIALCDTNGGSLPSWISEVVGRVKQTVDTALGIHTHNDSELAVANALAAVEAGCVHVQGTINGYGERCGNANLVPIVAALQLKMGHECVAGEKLEHLTELSRTVAELANMRPEPHAAYVGHSAFAHKGGVHVSAVEKVAESYEHVDPERVGNTRHVVVSELAGRGNVRVRAAELGVDTRGDERGLVARIKELENEGYQFEAAEGSFELLVRRNDPDYRAPFEIHDLVVISERRRGHDVFVEATVKLRVDGETRHVVAEGDGPVDALDRAMRKALSDRFVSLTEMHLTDFKVRILDPERAAAARTRVLLEATHAEEQWTTIGVADNIIEASCKALADSFELHLAREQERAQQQGAA
jgi:2-isopropylmalate synthase